MDKNKAPPRKLGSTENLPSAQDASDKTVPPGSPRRTVQNSDVPMSPVIVQKVDVAQPIQLQPEVVTSGEVPEDQDDDDDSTTNWNDVEIRAGGGDNEDAATSLEERVTWSNKWEFMMSCISMSVGLGNVWRFPVTAYRNGGGAFIIPYFIILVFIGRPIYFLELCLGQFASSGQVKVWKCAPIFTGIGFGMVMGAFCVMTYYATVLALPIYFFFLSFRRTLPWGHCDEGWAGVGSCYRNGTLNKEVSNQSLPELFFEKEVLKERANIDDGIGYPDWKLTLCLFASWLIIYFSIVKGVKSSGKVAYFTALFPYCVLLILLIKGVTLDGAKEGVMYFITPKWEKLFEPSVWYAAAAQCFFSLNTGTGSITMFSSYNRFHYNIYRDSFIFSFVDTFTSLLAGFITFSILGNLSHELSVPIENVIKGGAGLAFISYPDAIAKMDWAPQLIAVLFFLMLFTLGVGSATADTESIVTVFCDSYPRYKTWAVTLVICLAGFSVGIIYCTEGGQFILDLVDYYGGGFILYTMCTLEVIAIAWFYGLYNFITDIEFMLKIRLSYYWKVCWGILIPILLPVILGYSLTSEGHMTHNNVEYPPIAIACGWLIPFAALLCIIFGAVYGVRKSVGTTCIEKFKASFRPTSEWGPSKERHRRKWLAFKERADKRTFLQRLKDRSGS